jgi:hypothetical protein
VSAPIGNPIDAARGELRAMVSSVMPPEASISTGAAAALGGSGPQA